MTETYPLHWPEGWPRTPADKRRRAKFNKIQETGSVWQGVAFRSKRPLTIIEAANRILYELQFVGVTEREGLAILSSNLILTPGGSVRRDQREPADPGVALYWQAPRAPMRALAIDLYDRARDNMAAIAATLEALRKIERHGGAQVSEHAFRGFDALPYAPVSCWQTLGLNFDALRMNTPATAREAINARWRELAKDAHPDAGGTNQRMAELNAARAEALRAIGGA